jgi:hypothetical protein
VAFDLDDEIEAFFRCQPLAEKGDVPGINDYMKNPLKMLSLQGV